MRLGAVPLGQDRQGLFELGGQLVVATGGVGQALEVTPGLAGRRGMIGGEQGREGAGAVLVVELEQARQALEEGAAGARLELDGRPGQVVLDEAVEVAAAAQRRLQPVEMGEGVGALGVGAQDGQPALEVVLVGHAGARGGLGQRVFQALRQGRDVALGEDPHAIGMQELLAGDHGKAGQDGVVLDVARAARRGRARGGA